MANGNEAFHVTNAIQVADTYISPALIANKHDKAF